MNGNDREMIARLDERLSSIHNDVKDIKDSISDIHGRVGKDELDIAKIDTCLKNSTTAIDNHLKHHPDSGISTKQLVAIATLISAATASIGAILGAFR